MTAACEFFWLRRRLLEAEEISLGPTPPSPSFRHTKGAGPLRYATCQRRAVRLTSNFHRQLLNFQPPVPAFAACSTDLHGPGSGTSVLSDSHFFLNPESYCPFHPPR